MNDYKIATIFLLKFLFVIGNEVLWNLLEETTCPEAPPIENGYVSKGDYMEGAVRTISCKPGFALEGFDSTYCLSNGTWRQPGICIKSNVTCDPPELLLRRGEINFISKGSSLVSSTRTIECGTWQLGGPATMRCLPNGQWTRRGGCFPVMCSIPRVRNGYSVSTKGQGKGSTGIFACNEGYKLVGNNSALCMGTDWWHFFGACVH